MGSSGMEVLTPEIRCVVGIDVAKQAHMVCALEAPTGTLRQRPIRVEASAAGYAQLCGWFRAWGPPEQVLIGLEATGNLWEPLYDALVQAGYTPWLLNPRQTVAWATSLGLRAKTDHLDARTLARGLLAGYARASVLPAETIQAARTLTRARRDLVVARGMARQRLQDELVVIFPELPTHTPDQCDLAAPALLRLLSTDSSAQALAALTLEQLATTLAEVSQGRWGTTQAELLQAVAAHSAASTRAVAARSTVVRTLALHLLDLHARVDELEAAIAQTLADDEAGQRLQGVPGIGPQLAATIRAELGEVARFPAVDQVVAYAGLEPRTYQSGAYAGQRHLSKRGPGALRQALYLAAVVAIRCAPEWQTRYQRLLARGRAKKAALTILARGLLKVIYHLLRTGAAYDPARLAQPPAGNQLVPLA
jgi:transposase